jgi:hypothetical protein
MSPVAAPPVGLAVLALSVRPNLKPVANQVYHVADGEAALH